MRKQWPGMMFLLLAVSVTLSGILWMLVDGYDIWRLDKKIGEADSVVEYIIPKDVSSEDKGKAIVRHIVDGKHVMIDKSDLQVGQMICVGVYKEGNAFMLICLILGILEIVAAVIWLIVIVSN